MFLFLFSQLYDFTFAILLIDGAFNCWRFGINSKYWVSHKSDRIPCYIFPWGDKQYLSLFQGRTIKYKKCQLLWWIMFWALCRPVDDHVHGSGLYTKKKKKKRKKKKILSPELDKSAHLVKSAVINFADFMENSLFVFMCHITRFCCWSFSPKAIDFTIHLYI